MKRRILPLLLLCALALSTTALAMPGKPERGYVVDEAGVLSQETIDYVNEKNAVLAEATGAAIAVVAVDFMDGKGSDEYANELFNAWGIGDAERNNGLLLVFAVGENKGRALQGTGIENDLSTMKLSDWMDNDFFPEYDAQDYNAGVVAFVDRAYAWYESYYAQSSGAVPAPDSGYIEHYPQEQGVAYGLFSIVSLLFPLVVIIFIVVLCDRSRYNRYQRRYMGPGMPPPPIMYYPLFFGRRHYHHHDYHDHNNHRGPGPGGFGGFGGGFGGGGSHGGGAGRGGGFGGGGFGGGGFGGGFGGGGSRGGGAGR